MIFRCSRLIKGPTFCRTNNSIANSYFILYRRFFSRRNYYFFLDGKPTDFLYLGPEFFNYFTCKFWLHMIYELYISWSLLIQNLLVFYFPKKCRKLKSAFFICFSVLSIASKTLTNFFLILTNFSNTFQVVA